MINVNGKEVKWKHGDQLKVAQEVGITRQHLNQILRGQSCDSVLGVKISARAEVLGHKVNFINARQIVTLEVIS